MTMLAGTVTVSEDGTVTSTFTSLSKAIFDMFIANYTADTGEELPAGEQGAAIKMGYASVANNFSAALVPWMVANVDVSVHVSGLQRDPATGDPTLASVSPVILLSPLQ